MSSVPSSLHIGDTLSAARAPLRPQTASASVNNLPPEVTFREVHSPPAAFCPALHPHSPRTSPVSLSRREHCARAPALGYPPRSLPRSRQIRRPSRRARNRLGGHSLRSPIVHPGSGLLPAPKHLRRQGHRYAPRAAPIQPPRRSQPA